MTTPSHGTDDNDESCKKWEILFLFFFFNKFLNAYHVTVIRAENEIDKQGSSSSLACLLFALIPLRMTSCLSSYGVNSSLCSLALDGNRSKRRKALNSKAERKQQEKVTAIRR